VHVQGRSTRLLPLYHDRHARRVVTPPWRSSGEHHRSRLVLGLPEHAAGQRAAHTAAACVAAVVTVVTAATILVFALLVVRARVRGRSLLGSVIAPLAGASTTLLVTDIQVSPRTVHRSPSAGLRLLPLLPPRLLLGCCPGCHRAAHSIDAAPCLARAFPGDQDGSTHRMHHAPLLLIRPTIPAAIVIEAAPPPGGAAAQCRVCCACVAPALRGGWGRRTAP
jgi:hypothetical protein